MVQRRLPARVPLTRPEGQTRDSIPTNWYSCDPVTNNPSWCYGHVAIIDSPSGAGWAMDFDFDVRKPGNLTSPQQIWGSNWRVNGTGLGWQNWTNASYSNSATASHGEIFPIAYNTVNFTPLGQPATSHLVKIYCDLAWNLSPWNWTPWYSN